jgi:hypothetical protein
MKDTKLTDSEYNDLKNDEVISLNIALYTNIMKKSPILRTMDQQDEKEDWIKLFDSMINQVEGMISDNGRFIRTFLELDKSFLEEKLTILHSFKQDASENPKKVGKNTLSNRYLYGVCLRLNKLGYKVAERRIDFIYKLWLEYDIDSIQKDLELDKKTSDDFRARIKAIDHKAMNLTEEQKKKIIKEIM